MSRRTQATKLVDFPALFDDLARAGVCVAEASRRLGINQNTVYSWKKGCEPGYSDGVRLLALHAEVVAASRDSVAAV